MKIVSRAALLLAAALLAACDAGAPAKPLPGDLTVSLATPNVDGALVVAITGPDAVGAVQAAAPGTVVRVRTQGTTTTVAVFGAVAAGPLLRLTVSDVRQASRYAATVREAADEQNAPRASLAGYTLAVSR